jgi:hypothetical protein
MILRELLAKFGVSYDDSGARKADRDVEGLSSGFKSLIGLVGGAALVRGFGHFILQQVELADAIGDTAERLGVGVEALQELRFAGQDVGLSLEGVDAALGRLVRGSAEAALGQGEAKDAFKELGVSLTDGAGNLRSFDDILTQVADGMGGAKTDADRLRLGYALFGREGSKFAATMKNGSAGIEEMRAKARELGGVLSIEQVEAADKADKAINGFALAIGGLRNQIASQFIPKLTEGLTKLSAWIRPLRDLIGSSNIVAATLVTAGGALAVMFGGAKLLSLMKAGIAFGVIALALDSIITWAKDGDSVVGRLLEKLGGKGTSAAVLQGMKDAAEGLVLALKDISKFQGFLDTDYFGSAGSTEGFDRIAMAINRAHRGLAQLANFYRKYSGNAVGKDYDVPALMEPFQRTTGRGVNADVRLPGSDGVLRSDSRGVNAALAASGRTEQRGVAGVSPSYAGLPAAFASTQQMTPASGPVTLQQSVSINVEGSRVSDPNELARIIDRRLRKGMAESNADALRALRVVPP